MWGRNAPYEHVCIRTAPQSLNPDSSGMWPEQAEKFGGTGEPVFSLPLQWDRIDLFRECSRTGLHNRQKIVSPANVEGRATEIEIAPLFAGAGTPKHQKEKNEHA